MSSTTTTIAFAKHTKHAWIRPCYGTKQQQQQQQTLRKFHSKFVCVENVIQERKRTITTLSGRRVLPALARTTTATASSLLLDFSSSNQVWNHNNINSNNQQRRNFAAAAAAASSSNDDLRSYYHIEASNQTRSDATTLTVTGPDFDGMLASMTVALAIRGCSLVELHAGKNADVSYDRFSNQTTSTIKDIFYVVNRSTGKPFLDEDLFDLAVSLLNSLRSPMALVSSSGIGIDNDEAQAAKIQKQLEGHTPYKTLEDQIRIIESTQSK